MSGGRSENMEDEHVPLLPPIEHGDEIGRGAVETASDYSAISAADASTRLRVGGVRPKNRAVEAEHEYEQKYNETYYQNPETYQQYSGAGTNSSSDGGESVVPRGGPTVTCRICEAEILLEGRSTHVVRCQQCSEVTPIRAAPPGKKYVRCPCNCLLICKASSNRIACPRPNCRRVITLVASAPVGTAVRAPAGTCRVQCHYCSEMFMFNTLANNVAYCPHCKKPSSVGVNFVRSRILIYAICFAISFLVFLGVVLGTIHAGGVFVYMFWVILAAGTIFCLQRLVYYVRLKVSQVLGPI